MASELWVDPARISQTGRANRITPRARTVWAGQSGLSDMGRHCESSVRVGGQGRSTADHAERTPDVTHGAPCATLPQAWSGRLHDVAEHVALRLLVEFGLEAVAVLDRE